MNTNTSTKTPGYNCRLGIWFSTDKNGKKRAYYVGRMGQFRSFPIALDKAEAFVAQDQAELLDGNPFAWARPQAQLRVIKGGRA